MDTEDKANDYKSSGLHHVVTFHHSLAMKPTVLFSVLISGHLLSCSLFWMMSK